MRLTAVLLALIVSAGCTSSYIDMQPVDVYGWSKPVSIVYSNSDTTSLKDIAIAVRYNDYLRADTLSVDIQTSLPDVHQHKERIVLHLKRDYKATAITASESVPYRNACTLSQSGHYIFTITPCRTVKGVEAVGIDIKQNGKR